MNKVILSGRLVASPDIRYTQTGKAVANFKIAVNDGYGERKQTAFISCVAWQKTAEFVGNNFDKGKPILLEGRISTRTYDDQAGTKHYITEVVVNSVEFHGGEKSSGSADSTSSGESHADIGQELPPDEEIPF